ncbi:unnamed protein product [Clonostachys solani]|uniref:Zn(2)-C6 fungal-type domain-containing protein n=1 Tax=Clonostachys solani TaxID=160281 RepID=A0A9N9Z0P0_9HYPO|nr:unnamed protein product [Clonostachys solani]
MSLAPHDNTPPLLEESSNPTAIEEQFSPEISVQADGRHKAGSSRKRQKISLACEECRARKIKCDGVRPECSACRQAPKGVRACRYLSEPSRLSGHKRAMQSLHDRLAYLEAKLREAEAHKSAENIDSSNKEQDEEPVSIQSQLLNLDPFPLPGTHFDSSPPIIDPNLLPASHEVSKSPTSLAINGMGKNESSVSHNNSTAVNAMGITCVGSDIATDTDMSSEFYGEPSAASLLNDIQHHSHRVSIPTMQGRDSLSRHPQTPRHTLSMRHSGDNDDFHLPPQFVADDLLKLYRIRVQSIYPFLCWPIFMEAYNRLWLSDPDVKAMPQLTGIGLGGPNCSIPVFYCALNAAFALAIHFTEAPANERKERAAPFVRRSRHLMRLDFLDHGDLSTIQALLILARYLQNTGLSTRCWNVVGTAHRMAQGLGLHLEIGTGTASELETDIRRRVWHSCVCLETVAGMLTGRPCSNPDVAKVPFPDLLDTAMSEPSPPEKTDQGDSDTSSTMFFIHAIKLNQILNRILRQVYGSSKKLAECNWSHDNEEPYLAQQLASIIVLDQELDRFKAELPDSLSISKNASTSYDYDMLAHQRHVLHTRFLHIRSLLYRPLLVQLYRKIKAEGKASWHKTSPNTLNRAFVEKCSLACIGTAQALINHISTTSGAIHGGSPWFTSYYMYHAAMVIILADICYSDLHYPNHDSFHKSWQMCQDFFSRMLEYDSEASQYFRGLEHISRSIGSMHESSEDNEAALDSGSLQQWHQEFTFYNVPNTSLDQILTLAGGELMPSMNNEIGAEPSATSNQLWTLFK